MSSFIREKTDGIIDMRDKVYRTVLSIPLIIVVYLNTHSIVNEQNG